MHNQWQYMHSENGLWKRFALLSPVQKHDKQINGSHCWLFGDMVLNCKGKGEELTNKKNMSASCTQTIFSHKQRVDQERMQYSHGKNVLQAHHFTFSIFYKYFNDCMKEKICTGHPWFLQTKEEKRWTEQIFKIHTRMHDRSLQWK